MMPVSDLMSPPAALASMMVMLPWAAALGRRPLAMLWPGLSTLIGPLAIILGLLAGFLLWSEAMTAPIVVQLGRGAPAWGLWLHVDGLAVLAAITTLTLLVIFWPRHLDHPDPTRRDTAWLLLAGGCVGLAFAGDLAFAWLCLELCTLALCALLVLTGTLRSRLAMMDFLRLNLLGSALTLTGLGWGLAAPALTELPAGLLVLGLGLKTMMLPAPVCSDNLTRSTPASVLVVIAAVLPTLVLLSLARLSLSEVALRAPLMLFGLVTLGVGSYRLWRAREFPTLVLEFTRTSAGLTAVAFALSEPAGLFPGLALLWHLVLLQAAFCTLALTWRGSLADLTGIAWRTPLTGAVLVLLAASFIGVPPLPGFWIRLMLVLGLAQQSGPEGLAVLWGVILAAIPQAVAWLRLLRLIYARAPLDAHAGSALPRADRRAELLQPGGVERTQLVWVAGLLITATLLLAPLGQSLNRLVVQTITAPHAFSVIFTGVEP